MNVRTLLIGLAALLMAIVGAYFSVQGLGALFSGSKTEIMVMAGVMEFSKIITASFLYLYWDRVKFVMKTYLTIAVIILVCITSMGFYGYLTSAFQSSSNELNILDRRVEVIELRKDRFNEQIDAFNEERGNLTSTILTLSEGLSGNTIQYIDQETGQLVTTTSSATRNVLTTQLENAQERRDLLTERIDAYTDSITTFDERIYELRDETDVVNELGPLQFLADVLNVPMSTVVNIIAIVIMITFDPLAISLVIAFNLSLYYNRLEKDAKVTVKSPNTYEVYGERKSKPQKSVVKDDNEKVDDSSSTPIVDDSGEELEPPIEESHLQPESDVEEVKEEVVQTPNLEKKIGRVPVHIDKNSKEIDGYDTDGDGRIDVPTHSMKGRYADAKKPYYTRNDFDWSNISQWQDDQAAVNYWVTNIRDKRINSRYPDNFDSKIY